MVRELRAVCGLLHRVFPTKSSAEGKPKVRIFFLQHLKEQCSQNSSQNALGHPQQPPPGWKVRLLYKVGLMFRGPAGSPCKATMEVLALAPGCC